MSRLARTAWVSEALAIRLTSHRDQGLGQQLYVALRGWIESGELAAGEALPSSRQLARELSIARNTALSALDRLAAEGFVVSRPGAGLFVARLALAEAIHQAPIAPQKRQLSRRGDDLLADCALSGGHHRAFAPGIPALDLFPREQWQRLLRRHQQRAPESWLAYQSGGGVKALKTALYDYLRLSRSVRCTPEQILITQGAQQGFELIARMLTDPGDGAWIEEPGYVGAQVALKAAGLSLVPVPVDAEGIDIERAPQGAPPKLIYVTPSHQYPAGVTMSLARRLALLETARAQGSWIIEDDYDSEFRYSSPPLASLQGLMDQAPVIYVGTFSKVLYPGLRLGYLVLPEALVEPFQRANARINREGQYAVQAALAEFIEQGHFSRHVARMRRAYRSRQAALRRALAPAVDKGLTLSDGHAGMHLLAGLENVACEQTLVAAGRAQGIQLSPLSRYFTGPPAQAGLVLGYAGSHEQDIAQAGDWLARAWRRA